MRYSKIDKDLNLQLKVKEMLLKHSTPTAIGKQINVAKDTVKKYLISKDLPIFSREDENDKKNEESHILFIEDFKISNSITSSRKKFKITHDKAHKLLKRHDLVSKTRQEAALDKILSLEEAQSRLPNQNDKVTEYKDGKYTIETSDSFIYYKTSAKLIQGDPRGKSGTKKDTSEIARTVIENKKRKNEHKYKHSIEDLKKHALLKGGRCLSDKYESVISKYRWVCSEGHEFNSRWHDIYTKKTWCIECFFKSKYSIEDLKEYAKAKQGQCLSNEYFSLSDEYEWICNKGHRFLKTWSKCKYRGLWCAVCSHKKRADEKIKSSIEDLKEYAYSHKGECLSNCFVTCKEKYDWKCEKGHVWSRIWDGMKSHNQWCNLCSHKGVSKAETEVLDFARDCLGPDFIIEQGNRQILRPKEIDIYIPKLKLGIEYNGLYWHNEMSPNPRLRSYHYDKMKQCNEQGIRLVTIFEDEWTDRQFQVKSFLKSILGVCKQRVFARKCEMREVEKTIARDFLEAYHIQGKTSFKIAFGLYYEDELLGLVTGNVHHRQKGDDAPFVLNRLVFKDEVLIVGGASKLLKKLITHARENGYKKLISWSDNRWSEGNVYRKTGFSLEGELAPDYSYFDSIGLGRQSKQSNKKKNLIKKGAIGTMEMTERELALTLGLYRIHDCGKLRWTIDL